MLPQNYGRLLLSSEPGCHFSDVQPYSLHGNPTSCDGDVDIADVQRLASCWMRPFGTACPTTLDLNGWGASTCLTSSVDRNVGVAPA